jgi:hypothetical protein
MSTQTILLILLLIIFSQLTLDIAIAAMIINSVIAVQMHCEFSTFSPMSWYISPRYTCTAVNFETTFKDRILNNVMGLHDYGKADIDIKMLYMYKENCHYIPRNISGFFKYIDVLYIKDSNLQHLMTGDLDGFNGISTFDVSYNPIDHVGEDFFKGHSSIRIISFYACHIKQIDFGAFDSLTNLKEVSLEHNYCHDGVLKRALDANAFTAIYLTCQGNGLTLKSKVEKECLDDLRKSIDILEDEDFTVDESTDTVKTHLPSFPSILLTFTLLSCLILIVMCMILFKAYQFVSPRNFISMINEIN